MVFFFLMIRRPPRSTQSRSSAASDVYKRQVTMSASIDGVLKEVAGPVEFEAKVLNNVTLPASDRSELVAFLSLIHISEPTRPY